MATVLILTFSKESQRASVFMRTLRKQEQFYFPTGTYREAMGPLSSEQLCFFPCVFFFKIGNKKAYKFLLMYHFAYYLC